MLTGSSTGGDNVNWQRNGSSAPGTAPSLDSTYVASSLGYKVSTNNKSTWAAGTNNLLLQINAAPPGSDTATPEPATSALVGLGLLAALRFARR